MKKLNELWFVGVQVTTYGSTVIVKVSFHLRWLKQYYCITIHCCCMIFCGNVCLGCFSITSIFLSFHLLPVLFWTIYVVVHSYLLCILASVHHSNMHSESQFQFYFVWLGILVFSLWHSKNAFPSTCMYLHTHILRQNHR